MKHLFSRLALAVTLISMLTFLLGGTALAHQAVSTQQTHLAAVTAPLACPATIAEGSTGSIVGSLQSELNELHNDFDDGRFWESSPLAVQPFPLAVDNDFGPDTHNAVVDYQNWNGLTQDGIVGPQTWHSLGRC